MKTIDKILYQYSNISMEWTTTANRLIKASIFIIFLNLIHGVWTYTYVTYESPIASYHSDSGNFNRKPVVIDEGDVDSSLPDLMEKAKSPTFYNSDGRLGIFYERGKGAAKFSGLNIFQESHGKFKNNNLPGQSKKIQQIQKNRRNKPNLAKIIDLRHYPTLLHNKVHTDTVDIQSTKLRLLRELMKNHSIDCYIVVSNDEHQNEYVDGFDMKREYISGFTGSAGTALITLDKALMWVDGRYFLQAEQELDSLNWGIMKSNFNNTPNITDWMKENLVNGTVIGFYANVISYDFYQRMKNSLNVNSRLLVLSHDLIDTVREEFDPKSSPRTDNPIFNLADKIILGEEWMEKVTRIRNVINKTDPYALLIPELDDIAWLYNLRGDDIDYNPVFFAYTILTNSQLYIFVNLRKLPGKVKEALELGCSNKNKTNLCVKFYPYEDVYQFFSRFHSNFKIIYLPTSVNMRIYSSLLNSPDSDNVQKRIKFLSYSPTKWLKLIKNKVEIEGMKQAQYRDSAALIEGIAFLEEQIKNGQEWDELSILPKFKYYRSLQKYYHGLSFAPISGVGPNAAVIHYSTAEKTNRRITDKEIYLLDSGAQYYDGTTDVTRTFHFGHPKPLEIEAYTRVLQGSINLAAAIFPNYLSGRMIDVITREPLWAVGLDYRHGTGHGIGSFLNVHEGPIFISAIGSLDIQLKHGMFISDEPGFYKDNDFGVRLETIVMVKNYEPKYNYSGQSYLTFEPMTLVPFETNLIDYKLLTCTQLIWLNNYNCMVKKNVGPILEVTNSTRAMEWIQRRTLPLDNLLQYNHCKFDRCLIEN